MPVNFLLQSLFMQVSMDKKYIKNRCYYALMFLFFLFVIFQTIQFCFFLNVCELFKRNSLLYPVFFLLQQHFCMLSFVSVDVHDSIFPDYTYISFQNLCYQPIVLHFPLLATCSLLKYSLFLTFVIMFSSYLWLYLLYIFLSSYLAHLKTTCV